MITVSGLDEALLYNIGLSQSDSYSFDKIETNSLPKSF